MPRRRPPMETFSFRASADVMAAARRTAKKRGEYLSDAIRDFVTRYARDEIRAARSSEPAAAGVGSRNMPTYTATDKGRAALPTDAAESQP